MPIPPRAIPRSNPSTTSRPGHSVPHKARSTLSPSASDTMDWRAEVAFLDSYAHSSRAWSVPSAGVVIMDAATRAREETRRREMDEQVTQGREVGLDELIQDGKGRREKRATTAATLGFDFIHTPSVLVLPDSEPKSTTPTRTIPATSGRGRSAPSPLFATPQTPGLLASSPVSGTASLTSRKAAAQEEEDEDLDSWEHVLIADGDEGEGEEMMLGELELELDMDGLDLIDKREVLGMRRVEGLSYAAALGGR